MGSQIAALVFGIASLFVVFAQFTGVAAIVLGSIGLVRGNSGAGDSKPYGVSGLARRLSSLPFSSTSFRR